MASTRSALRLLPLSYLLFAAVSAAPGKKCGGAAPVISSSAVISGSAVISSSVVISSPGTVASTVVPSETAVVSSADSTSASTSPTSSTPDVTVTPTPTTTQEPDLTTITSCPPTPTYNGTPELCFASGHLPAMCQALSRYDPRAAAADAMACQSALTASSLGLTPVAAATTCFSGAWAVAASTAYSCLMAPSASLLCSYDANCATNTYIVGQEPTATATATATVSATASAGPNLIPDGSFDDGTLGNWTVSTYYIGSGSSETLAVSAANPRSAPYSIAIDSTNVEGFEFYISYGNNLPLEPGAQYQLSFWYYQVNPGAGTILSLAALPMQGTGSAVDNVATVMPANEWASLSLTFTAVASWLRPQITVDAGWSQDIGGADHLYIDDISLVRLS